MKTPNTAPVIRIIKLILDVAWYGAIASLVIVAALWMVISGGMPLPWYKAQVELEPNAAHYEMKRADTGSPLTLAPSRWYRESLLEASGELAINPPGRLFAVAYNAISLLKILFTLAVLYLLRKLFSALKDESPFTRANAMRVRAIGLFIFLGHFTVTLLSFALSNYLNTIVITQGVNVRTTYHPNYQVLFLGLVLIALAELFRHGVALEEEQALTI